MEFISLMREISVKTTGKHSKRTDARSPAHAWEQLTAGQNKIEILDLTAQVRWRWVA